MTIRDLKVEILKQEIEILNQKINHFDDLRHRTKQMALTSWLAAVGVGLSARLHAILFLAAFVPLPFWVIESFYHAYQEGWNARFWSIRKFIQTGRYTVQDNEQVRLEECLSSEDFGAFPVPDYYARNTLSREAHRRKTSKLRNFAKRKMVLFYLPLVAIAVVLNLVI